MRVSSRTTINSILRRDDVSSKYGAPMGRRNLIGDPGPIKVELVRFVDGDYDAGGAYWGGGRDSQNLYCGWRQDMGEEERTRVFVRADSRRDAIAMILEELGDGWSIWSEPSPVESDPLTEHDSNGQA